MTEIEKLDTLASQINEEHRAFRQAFRATYRSALKTGDLLNEAKAAAGHGNWAAWVEENCEFSMRTAQDYMRLANNREQVEARLKSADSADLSIAGVLKELAAPKPVHVETYEVEDGVMTWEPAVTPREPAEPVALEDVLEELGDRAGGVVEHYYRQKEEKRGTEAAQAWLGEHLRSQEEARRRQAERELQEFKSKPEYVADQLWMVVAATTASFEDIPQKNPLPGELDNFEWRRVLALIEHKRDERAVREVERLADSSGILGAKEMRRDLGYVLRYHQMADIKRLPEDIELLRKAGRNYAAIADALEAGMKERANDE